MKKKICNSLKNLFGYFITIALGSFLGYAATKTGVDKEEYNAPVWGW